jgi:3-hydroxyisobutyrate dehydrogenase
MRAADQGENSVIGFIGIGNMGWPMASNLSAAGYTVLVFDSARERAARFAAEKAARAAASLAELGAGAGVIVTMLPTGAVVRQVMLEAEGGALAATLRAGSLVIDMGSSEPVGTRSLGAALAARRIALVDAPVSGGVPRATDGSLAIMIGGDDKAALARARPILATMGKRLFETGALGSGHAMKALNNVVAAACFAASAEAIVAGERFGLDPKIMAEIMCASTGRNFALEVPIKDHALTGTHATGFSLGLLAKDVRIAADLARSIGCEAPLIKLVDEQWARACATIGAEKDHSKAIEWWRRPQA